MKRTIQIISILAAAALTMTACGKDQDDSSAQANKCRIVSYYECADYENNICFAVDENSRLDFVDLSTLEDSPVCDDPSCKHLKGSECTAYGKDNHPFIYNKKLYYLRNSDIIAKEDGTYTINTTMYCSDINGANEKKTAEIKDLSYSDYDRMAVIGSTAYMIMTAQPYDKDFKELEPSMELVAVSLDIGDVEKLGEAVKGYSCGAWVYGIWNGKLIFSATRSTDNRPYMERLQDFADKNGLDEDEAVAQYSEDVEYETSCLAYDISNKKIEENSLPEPQAISENYYYYLKDNKLCYLDKDNKEQTIEDAADVTDVASVNGYVVIGSESGQYLFNESDKSLVKLNDTYDIAAIKDDQAIIKTDGTPAYEKRSISELEQPK